MNNNNNEKDIRIKIRKKYPEQDGLLEDEKRGKNWQKSERRIVGRTDRLETFRAPIQVKQKCFWKITCIRLIYTITRKSNLEHKIIVIPVLQFVYASQFSCAII
jgi:hypothetical protein